MADVATAATPDVPTGQEHKYHFNIVMSCGGCSGAVDRVLKKLEGKMRPPFPLHSQRSPLLRRRQTRATANTATRKQFC